MFTRRTIMVYNLRGVARTLPGFLRILAGVDMAVVMKVCGDGLDWEPEAMFSVEWLIVMISMWRVRILREGT
jgi:hypothetical protein